MMQEQELLQIAKWFRGIGARLTSNLDRVVRPEHLARHLTGYGVQAGRLVVGAIDAGAFPEFWEQQNRGWWDRNVGQVPGDVLRNYLKTVVLADE